MSKLKNPEKNPDQEQDMKIWAVYCLDNLIEYYHSSNPPCGGERSAIPFPANTENIPDYWFCEGACIVSAGEFEWKIFATKSEKGGLKFIIVDRTGKTDEIGHNHFHHAVLCDDFKSYNDLTNKFLENHSAFGRAFDQFDNLRNFLTVNGFLTVKENARLEKIIDGVFNFRHNFVPVRKTHLKRLLYACSELNINKQKLSEAETELKKLTDIDADMMRSIRQACNEGAEIVRKAAIGDFDCQDYLDASEKIIGICMGLLLSIIELDIRVRDENQLNHLLGERIPELVHNDLRKHLIKTLTKKVADVKAKYND